jgi:HlyD family secretion protein
VRKAALNVANVVTYVAVVRFANADGRLLPGMTANVRIVTDTRQDVLKVPNAALRMRIAEPPSATKKVAAPAGPTCANGTISSNTARKGRIYLLDAVGQPVATSVCLGITDGSSTELLNPDAGLQDGTAIVIGNPLAGAPRASAPRLPF